MYLLVYVCVGVCVCVCACVCVWDERLGRQLGYGSNRAYVSVFNVEHAQYVTYLCLALNHTFVSTMLLEYVIM